MRLLKAGTLYFVLTFAAGFVLGALRVTWLEPRLGQRVAELMEMPVMLLVLVPAARWVIRRLEVPDRTGVRLGMGGIALGWMLLAELGVILAVRGLTLREYLWARDPVSGIAYLGMLGVFAVAPLALRSLERNHADSSGGTPLTG
jgi:hypothetical protein